jgi:uncharacterized protein
MAAVQLAALCVYPVKSCRGIDLTHGVLTATGLQADRQWMIVDARNRFVTQREQPRLALIEPTLTADGLQLKTPGLNAIAVGGGHDERIVTVWQDTLAAIDEGEAVADWLTALLGVPVRLVRFAPQSQRISNRAWTGELIALNYFSDGYPLLAIGSASLADLNRRLAIPLPMNRFRPNLVLSGLEPYDEDRIHELVAGEVRLRVVKPCSRCKITAVDQASGEPTGEEPIPTLKRYRWNAELRGVMFGQNVAIAHGAGMELAVGQQFDVRWK